MTGEGYGRTRRMHDPLAGVHAFDRNRLLTDRSAYVSFLEVQLERVTAACLATQGFSDRIDQLQQQIATARPGGTLTRPCSCQGTCARLVDDAMAAVQAVDAKIDKLDMHVQQRFSDTWPKVLSLLRQVVTKQRDIQLKVSGNFEISGDAPGAVPVVATADAPAPTPAATLPRAPTTAPFATSVPAPVTAPVATPFAPPPAAGARVRAVSAPTAAATQARRRRAVEELLRELENETGN